MPRGLGRVGCAGPEHGKGGAGPYLEGRGPEVRVLPDTQADVRGLVANLLGVVDRVFLVPHILAYRGTQPCGIGRKQRSGIRLKRVCKLRHRLEFTKHQRVCERERRALGGPAKDCWVVIRSGAAMAV